jgi:hypothetical protein
MTRDLWLDELEAAVAAIKALTEAQAKLPSGFYFNGSIQLQHEHGTYGTLVTNDFDSFNYLPEERVI